MRETLRSKILAMHEDGMTAREISDELENSLGSVYATLYKFGLRSNKKPCPNCGYRP